MHDALLVRRLQRAGDLRGVTDRVVQRQGPVAAQPVVERLALDVLHDEVAHAVLLADVVERADVGVVQAGDRLPLAHEPALEVVVGRHVLGKDLDGDGAVEAGVARPVYLTHPAHAKRGLDLVWSERSAWRQGHGL